MSAKNVSRAFQLYQLFSDTKKSPATESRKYVACYSTIESLAAGVKKQHEKNNSSHKFLMKNVVYGTEAILSAHNVEQWLKSYGKEGTNSKPSEEVKEEPVKPAKAAKKASTKKVKEVAKTDENPPKTKSKSSASKKSSISKPAAEKPSKPSKSNGTAKQDTKPTSSTEKKEKPALTLVSSREEQKLPPATATAKAADTLLAEQLRTAGVVEPESREEYDATKAAEEAEAKRKAINEEIMAKRKAMVMIIPSTVPADRMKQRQAALAGSGHAWKKCNNFDYAFIIHPFRDDPELPESAKQRYKTSLARLKNEDKAIIMAAAMAKPEETVALSKAEKKALKKKAKAA